jgi:hypothetical protein
MCCVVIARDTDRAARGKTAMITMFLLGLGLLATYLQEADEDASQS